MLRIKILVPIIATVAAAAVVGLLAFQIWNPSWNPFGLSPQQRLDKAIANLFLAETFKTDGFLDFEIKTEEEPENFIISFRFSTKVDKKEPENTKTEGSYNLGFGEQGFEISIAGDIKTIGEDFYFKITSLPDFPLLSVMLKGLENQWIKIDKETLAKTRGEKIEDLEQKKEEQKKLWQDLTSLFKRRKMFEVKEKLKGEEIDREKTLHLLVKVRREELRTLIPELLKIIERYSTEEQKVELQEFLKDFPQKFDEVYDKVGEINFEVWISKKDNYLKKLKGEKEFDLSKFEQFQTSSIKEGKIKIKFDARFSLFNQKMKIEIPESFKKLDEVFPQIPGGGSLPLFLPGK